MQCCWFCEIEKALEAFQVECGALINADRSLQREIKAAKPKPEKQAQEAN
jgi:hypothetical protein